MEPRARPDAELREPAGDDGAPQRPGTEPPERDTALFALGEGLSGDPLHGSVARGAFALLTRRGPGKRQNEDGALVLPLGVGRAVLAVADGMGGLPFGDRAARIALEALARHCSARCAGHAPGGAPRARGLAELVAALAEAFDVADSAVRAEAAGAGATLVAAAIADGAVQLVHAGDAEGLVFGQRGRVKRRTVPHSPTGLALEQGLLDERAALLHDERHIVSNAIGLAPLTVEVGRPCALAARDTLVLASDGLFDNLTRREVADAVRRGPLAAALAGAAARASARMVGAEAGAEFSKPDDLTVLLYRPAPR